MSLRLFTISLIAAWRIPLVDDEDYERENEYIWTVATTVDGNGLIISNRTLNIITLGRFLLNLSTTRDVLVH
ncbi:hypothetical protein [Lysinibacillus sp. NPDC097868]|uniref:hypothetical protein n=1 Tax=Lysinibacillus sp. NPDC097868 TaxID=3364145 RepID=UPI00380FC558